MHEVSEGLQRVIQKGHTMTSRVDIVDNTGTIILSDLPVEGGNVQGDARNAIRRRASIRLFDYNESFTPGEWDDLLHPLSGNEIRLYRGAVTGHKTETETVTAIGVDGTPKTITFSHKKPIKEYVQLGVFDPYAVDISDSGENLNIGIDCYDRARRIQRSRLLRPYQIARGTNYGDAIRELLDFRVPGLRYNFVAVDFVTPELRFGASGDEQGGGDPWQYAQEMAEAIGHRLFFDTHGSLMLLPVVNISRSSVSWHYHEGENSTILSAQKRLTKEETFNHVVASGTSLADDEPTVRAEAWDNNPDSPTYAGAGDPPDGNSILGDIPTFFTSSHLRTEEQAQAVADARLNQVLGYQETMNTTNIVNPAQDLEDIIHIERERARINTVYIVDKLNINLSASQAMNLTVRERMVLL